MTDILITDFVKGLLIFLRITGVIFIAPIFSNRSFPTSAKIFFSLVIAYMVFFTVGDFEFNVEDGLMTLAILGLKEVITGIIMGFMINFVFYGMSYAGVLIGFDMGLAMARMFDPTTETQTNMMGQAMLIVATLIFLAINGHHYVVRGLAYSFSIVPIGFFEMSQPLFNLLIKYSAAIFVLAVKIASPIMVSMFLINLGSGIVARVLPQMNVFFVMHPIKMGLGFAMLASLTPIYIYIIRNILMSYEDKLFNLVKIMGS